MILISVVRLRTLLDLICLRVLVLELISLRVGGKVSDIRYSRYRSILGELFQNFVHATEENSFLRTVGLTYSALELEQCLERGPVICTS